MQVKEQQYDIQLPYNEYFKSHIYKQCKEAIENYDMIHGGDRVALEITFDCNTLTLLAFFLEYQKEREYDFSMEFFVEAKGGKIEEKVEKVLKEIGITKYQTIESLYKEELYQRMKESRCNRMALHQNYNHLVKATFMTFLCKKKQTVIAPVIELEKHGITMIRPMLMVKDSHIVHWIKKVGVDVRLADEITLFGGASLSEEGIANTGLHSGAEYQFKVYERV